MKKLILTLLAATAFAATAAAKDSLSVYTYDSFAGDYGPGKAVKAAFEKTCDCELNFVALGDGVAVLNRLKLEGKDTKADVVLGLDLGAGARRSQGRSARRSRSARVRPLGGGRAI